MKDQQIAHIAKNFGLTFAQLKAFVVVQNKECNVYNGTYEFNPNIAIESTTIGFHYKNLGFREVTDMWDFAKVDEINKLILRVRFLQLNHQLFNALKNNDWDTFTYFWNEEQRAKHNYHTILSNAHEKALLINF